MTQSFRVSIFLLCTALSACASTPPRQPDARDPFERFNRASFAFNEALDRRVAKPAARGYQRVVPRIVRRGVSNFFTNLEQPAVFLSDALQGKPRAYVGENFACQLPRSDLNHFEKLLTWPFAGVLVP